jgi:hypothetical protein
MRPREREREIITICARVDLEPKRNKKQIKRERLRFESERRRGGEQFALLFNLVYPSLIIIIF